MTTQEKLIEGLKAAFPDESQAALARRAGLSVQRFNNYCTGIRTMDVDAVIGCAQALGWDIRKSVADHEIETAPSPRVKALWRKLAATAMVVAISAGIGATPTAAKASGFEASPVYRLCKTAMGLVGYYVRLFKLGLASILPPIRSKDKASIDACVST